MQESDYSLSREAFVSSGYGSHQKSVQHQMKILTDHYLHQSKKLVLVLDIDHTLLHTTKNPHADIAFKRKELSDDIFMVSLNQSNGDGDVTYYVKLRPHLKLNQQN
ncbi:hypothetical protein MHBO_000079 [Bonamia ostreae]|uniref:protein-serine/threonine phosphatase n=1 Tax=Bonamia ostreae TaxID=126728 RepID=A0ABV2AF22_9EUKA